MGIDLSKRERVRYPRASAGAPEGSRRYDHRAASTDTDFHGKFVVLPRITTTASGSTTKGLCIRPSACVCCLFLLHSRTRLLLMYAARTT